MTTWFVSRHSGAIDWIREQDYSIDRFETHLDVNLIQNGDVVIGVLPIAKIYEVCKKGARFFALDFDQAQETRGKELTLDQLTQFKCHVQEYVVTVPVEE